MRKGQAMLQFGVAAFSLLVAVLAGDVTPTVAEGGLLFLRAEGADLLFGLSLGLRVSRVLHHVEKFQLEGLLILAALAL